MTVVAANRRSATASAKDRLAANLRRIAEEKEWTQHDMADACSMRQPNIARVMNADLAVTLETLDRFADGLNVDVLELLEPDAVQVSEWNINDIRQRRRDRREVILKEAMEREKRRRVKEKMKTRRKKKVKAK